MSRADKELTGRVEVPAELLDGVEPPCVDTPAGPAVLTPGEQRRLLHELQVHRIELKAQNEELCRASAELEASRASYQSVVRDLAESRRAEAALRYSEALYRTLFEGAAEGILIAKAETREFQYANPAMCRMLGYTEHELRRLGVTDIHPSECTEQVLADFDSMVHGDVSVVEVPSLCKDGRVIDVSIAATCLVLDGCVMLFGFFSDVTARKQAERELRKNQELLKAIQNLSKVGGWLWDIEQQIMYWTEETYRIHDYAPVDLGTDLQEHITKSLGCCAEVDRPVILAAFMRCVEHGDPYDIEYPFTTHTGRRLWARTSAHAVWEGTRIVKVVGNIIDVTERKQAEQTLLELNACLEYRVAERTLALNQSERRFRALAEASFEGVAISEDGILLDGNSHFARMHGYELAEMIGRPATDFIAPESQSLVRARMASHGNESYEFVGMRKDGSYFPAEVRGRMEDWMGRTVRISTLRDLTESKQAALSLHVLQAEFEQVQRLAFVSEVNAGIIHQISQPLSAMAVNIASVAARLRVCEKQRCELEGCSSLEIIRDIDADIVRMRGIVSQLRALMDPQQPQYEDIDFNHAVTGVLPLLQQKAAVARISLGVELDQELRLVHANAVQVCQVIYNLIHNALEACKDAPPERRRATLTTRALNGDGIEFCVRDAGIGLSPAVAARLFTPFFSTKAGGSGIGLRLSQTIVHAHGGSITGYNNADGVGATFRVVLPYKAPDERRQVMGGDSR